MDARPVWYRQFISAVVSHQLQHNLHLLSAPCWMVTKTSHKHEDFIADRLVRIYGAVSKSYDMDMKRK